MNFLYSVVAHPSFFLGTATALFVGQVIVYLAQGYYAQAGVITGYVIANTALIFSVK